MEVGNRIRFQKGLTFDIGKRFGFRIERGEEGVIVKQEDNGYHVRIDNMDATVLLTEDMLNFYTEVSHDKTRYIKWEYEDQLGFNITDKMFKASKIIDGVRMYPYIEVGFNRYYLEDGDPMTESKHFYTDMVALEDLFNLSVCVKTDYGIRRFNYDSDRVSKNTVFVCNVPKVNQENNFIIRKGEYVRYCK